MKPNMTHQGKRGKKEDSIENEGLTIKKTYG